MIRFSAKVEGETLTKRGVSEVKRVCNRLAGLEVREQLDDHFAQNAQQRFKYKRRSRAYNQRKQRLFGHTRPLVFSGDLERAILSSAKVTATSKGSKVKARGSRSSNLRGQLKDELEIVTKKKREEIRRNYESNFVELAKRSEYRRKV